MASGPMENICKQVELSFKNFTNYALNNQKLINYLQSLSRQTKKFQTFKSTEFQLQLSK